MGISRTFRGLAARAVELEFVEPRAPFEVGPVNHGLAEREDIERDEGERYAPAPSRDRREHRVEVVRASLSGDEFAVEHRERAGLIVDKRREFRQPVGEVVTVTGPDPHRVVHRDNDAPAVELRLDDPVAAQWSRRAS